MHSITFLTIRGTRLVIVLSAMIVLMAGVIYLTGQRTMTNASVIRMPPLALTQSNGNPDLEQHPTAVIGQPAPDFALSDLDGAATSLSSLRGQPVLLYFWATWCHHCNKSLPELMEVEARHRENGLHVLAVNILESPEKVAAYVARENIDLPVLLDARAHVSQVYLIRATPTYVLIDRDGILHDVIIGRPRPGVLDARLMAILAPISDEMANES